MHIYDLLKFGRKGKQVIPHNFLHLTKKQPFIPHLTDKISIHIFTDKKDAFASDGRPARPSTNASPPVYQHQVASLPSFLPDSQLSSLIFQFAFTLSNVATNCILICYCESKGFTLISHVFLQFFASFTRGEGEQRRMFHRSMQRIKGLKHGEGMKGEEKKTFAGGK